MPKAAPKLGRFDPGTPPRVGGRRIDTWTYRSGLPGQEAIEVKVNLVTVKAGEYRFVAKCVVFDAPLEDSDLTVLRRRADEVLQAHCTDTSELKWEDWLEVMVSGRADSKDGRQMGLVIKYRTLQRALLPDGKAVTVNARGRISPFPAAHRAAAAMNPEEFILSDRNSATEISYIPATADALQALHHLQDRLDQLRLSLSALLTQDSITERLPAVAAHALALTHEVKA